MKAGLLVAALAAVGVAAAPSVPASNDGAVIKITVPGGHGSAVHIGNGYFLTAAHVVKGPLIVDYKTDGGKTGKAEVIWEAKQYDIALIKGDGDGIAKVDLECRAPKVGEDLQFKGSPINLEFITTWGKVSGTANETGPWKHATPVNAAVIPGMSGGPVLDSQGDLVGINVGLMILGVGFGGGPAGIGYIVPGDVICGIMGLDT